MADRPAKKKAVRVKIRAVVEDAPVDLDAERLNRLRRQRDECSQECARISKEVALLEDASRRAEIADIALPPTMKLVDLFVQRVLDPSPDWKQKIDTLINIPNSMAGENMLRGGSYFEALFQLAIYIGVLDAFRGPKTFYDIRGYKKRVVVENYIYTKPILNAGGSETGIADILFELSTSGKSQSSDYSCGVPPPPPTSRDAPTYFISVKGYRKEKSISHGYDVSQLFQQMSVFPELKSKHIVVCVRNKSEFLTRLGRTQQEFLKSSIDTVIGYDEVMDAFDAYRIQFFSSMPPSPSVEKIRARVGQLFPKNAVAKPILSLYFHQELIAKAVVNRIRTSKPTGEPHFLCIGVLPRGGKSYIAGAIIDRLRTAKGVTKPFNVLFLTSAVSETREQFSKDLINKFAEFSSFEFIDPVEGKLGSGKEQNSFVFVSRQLTGKKVVAVEEEESETSIAETDIVSLLTEKLGRMPSFDICFFDEAHIGIRSETVRSNFAKAFAQFNMPIVLMTATYSKTTPIIASNQDLFIWDLQDVQEMKRLPITGFDEFTANVLDRYSPIAKQVIDQRRALGETAEHLASPYTYFPMPNFISLTFAPDTVKHLRDSGTGYDYTAAFEIKKGSPSILNFEESDDWGKLLTNRSQALHLRQFLTPEAEPNAEEDPDFLQGKDRKYRALNQIFRIAHTTGSRPVAGVPFSMIMFLPFGPGLPPIGELCRVWASFMRESSYWRSKFVFLTLSPLNTKKYKPDAKMTPELAVSRGICHREDFKTSLKDTIETIERAALAEGKGLVLLSGDVAKMGISLKCVDVVCLMSTNKDADDIIQKMYRGLTNDPPRKTNGFIIDLNMKRIVTAMFDYAMDKATRGVPADKKPSVSEVVSSVFQLCNWGQDAFIEDETAKGRTFTDIMADIKVRVIDEITKRITLKAAEDVGKKQVQAFLEIPQFRDKMKHALAGTAAKRKKTATKVVLGERNPDLPASQAASEVDDDEERVAPVPSAPTGLTDEQIRAKMGDILATFVNALVIRSPKKWSSGLTFTQLFAGYLADKATAASEIDCTCSETSSCSTPHSNSYETVFCELKPYATDTSGAYLKDSHLEIIALLNEIFQNPAALTTEWNAYVQGLIDKLADSAPTKAGVRHHTTWKNRKSKVKYGRRTHRNRSRYY